MAAPSGTLPEGGRGVKDGRGGVYHKNNYRSPTFESTRVGFV